jgi:hypothetical protein
VFGFLFRILWLLLFWLVRLMACPFCFGAAMGMDTPIANKASTPWLIEASFRRFENGAFEQVKRSYFIV